MDKLSKLLKEAKPLYNQRQRRKKVAKYILLLTMPMFITTGIYEIYQQGNELYLSLRNNSLQNELMQDEFGLLR